MAVLLLRRGHDKDGTGPALPARHGFFVSILRGTALRRTTWWALCLICLALAGSAVVLEAQTSFLQSILFSRLAREMTFKIGTGPSPDIRFPQGGPYDERLGYTALPSFSQQLTQHHFRLDSQAVQSPELEEFADAGGYAVYSQKAQAGFTLLDRHGQLLYTVRNPGWVYEGFRNIPPLMAETLLFIEDRSLLDDDYPRRNPAVEWNRFLLASFGRLAGWINPHFRRGGASTLATQIEKFQHSPEGRTDTIGDKLRQMATAALRAYRQGVDTLPARQEILATYLNATPLSSRPGYGEVIGIGDGLWVWYGTDFTEANQALTVPVTTPATLEHQARIYKQVLSLLLAQRRPSYYLVTDHAALEALTDRYLKALAAAGVIDSKLHDAALKTPLRFRAEPPAPPSASFVDRKAIDAVRTELLSDLRLPTLYGLDRIDVTAQSTIDATAQKRVTEVLSQLGQRDYVASLGMIGKDLLGPADPSRVTYSVVLYERGKDRNYLRVHADSLDEPFDINSGAKLILGSTAKLRTLITYLNIITALHDRYAGLPSATLARQEAKAPDALSRWSIAYLAGAKDRSLQKMLDAAVQRRYSASPAEAFFTGSGRHVFHNFEKWEDYETPTVAAAFDHSINLAFIRLMRDILHYYLAENIERQAALAADGPAGVREAYLHRFADQEGRQYLNRFWDDYHGLTDQEALSLLASRTRPVDYRLAVAFRSARPQASIAEMRDFLKARAPGLHLDDIAIATLYEKYGPDKFSLSDRGYLAGVHPLELWLADYLHSHPKASRGEMLQASTAERQAVYRWLFKTHNPRRQDMRIRILLEEDAFNQILQDWRRLGYPFAQLVPSLATAIGSSGDRPDALAALMGIILNDGVKQSTVDLDKLHFADGTPFDTAFSAAPTAPQQVIAPEIARTVRRMLMGVVAEGTATRLRNAYQIDDGKLLEVGGKTGTGDNRFETFAAGGTETSSRVVDRTATFVFFLGNRFYGTVTAYVPGSAAANYHFTSALAVQLLAAMAPQLHPFLTSTD